MCELDDVSNLSFQFRSYLLSVALPTRKINENSVWGQSTNDATFIEEGIPERILQMEQELALGN